MPYDVTTITLPCGTQALRAVGSGIITREDAEPLMQELDHGRYRGMPQIWLTQQMKQMTPEARSIFSKAPAEGVQRAWCVIVGASPLIRVTVNFLLRISRQGRLTKMFSTEPPAVAWLDERVREDAAKKTAAT